MFDGIRQFADRGSFVLWPRASPLAATADLETDMGMLSHIQYPPTQVVPATQVLVRLRFPLFPILFPIQFGSPMSLPAMNNLDPYTFTRPINPPQLQFVQSSPCPPTNYDAYVI